MNEKRTTTQPRLTGAQLDELRREFESDASAWDLPGIRALVLEEIDRLSAPDQLGAAPVRCISCGGWFREERADSHLAKCWDALQLRLSLQSLIEHAGRVVQEAGHHRQAHPVLRALWAKIDELETWSTVAVKSLQTHRLLSPSGEPAHEPDSTSESGATEQHAVGATVGES